MPQTSEITIQITKIYNYLNQVATEAELVADDSQLDQLLEVYKIWKEHPNKVAEISELAEKAHQCFAFVENDFEKRHNWNSERRDLFTDYIIRKIESKLSIEGRTLSKMDDLERQSFMLKHLQNQFPLNHKVNEVSELHESVASNIKIFEATKQMYETSLQTKSDKLNEELDECVTAEEFLQKFPETENFTEEQLEAKQLLDTINEKQARLEAITKEYNDEYEQSMRDIEEAGAQNQSQQLLENQNLFENLRLVLDRLKLANNVTDIEELISRSTNDDTQVPGKSFVITA